jgi:hypothetical protein
MEVVLDATQVMAEPYCAVLLADAARHQSTPPAIQRAAWPARSNDSPAFGPTAANEVVLDLVTKRRAVFSAADCRTFSSRTTARA